jgi:hypothetical protein
MFAAMTGRLFAAAILFVAMFASAANAQTVTNQAGTVVELYTSQGCSQCPRANRLLGMFAAEDGVLALTFPVSIWDYLGWEDTFAAPEFTFRQRAYARSLRARRFTPQLVLNGTTQLSASYWDEARAIMDRTKAQPINGGPDISITRPRSNRVRVTLGTGARRPPADVWIAAIDPGPISAYVADGVNINRRVNHYNLVRWLERVGEWNGEPIWFERSRCTPECAVLIQEPNGGRILSAAFTSGSD